MKLHRAEAAKLLVYCKGKGLAEDYIKINMGEMLLNSISNDGVGEYDIKIAQYYKEVLKMIAGE